MKYVLALDQGTTSSRAIVFDQIGQIVGKAQREFKQIYTQPGWVEHDPKDIFSSQVGVIPEAIADAGITTADISAVGITNQRETTIVWEKSTGKPVYNAIVWQCRRTASYCDSLRKKYAKTIYKKTGLILDAYFSATKIKWILDNVPGAREKAENGELLFGTVDTFLMWNLSQGKIFATDYTNASRTMLFNVHTLDWDDELLSIFGVPRSMLPSVYPSSHFFGTTEPTVAGGLSAKITGVAGDQQSALFGHLATKAGDVKNTYGTGCFLLMNTGTKAVSSKNGLVTTLAACRDGEKPSYVLEGSVFVGGAVVQWLRDEMKLVETAAETEQIAMSVSSSNGVYVVPAFTGLGAPHWDSEARGTVTGITRGTSRAHFVRAALESIAYEVSDIVFAMQNDSGVKLNTLNVDGGACANNFLMQLQSDLLCAKVVRPILTETTALGACYLAGLSAGVWESIDEIKSNVTVDREFVPSMDETKRKELLDGWKKAVRQTRMK